MGMPASVQGPDLLMDGSGKTSAVFTSFGLAREREIDARLQRPPASFSTKNRPDAPIPASG